MLIPTATAATVKATYDGKLVRSMRRHERLGCGDEVSPTLSSNVRTSEHEAHQNGEPNRICT